MAGKPGFLAFFLRSLGWKTMKLPTETPCPILSACPGSPRTGLSPWGGVLRKGWDTANLPLFPIL